MKHNKFIFTLITLLTMSSCVKTETAKPKVSELKTNIPSIAHVTEPNFNKKSGYKCEIDGLEESNINGQKEIFIQLTKTEAGVKVEFHDFLSDNKVSAVSATFDGYKLLGFKMVELNDEFIGEAGLLHDDIASLSPGDEVLTGSVRLILDKELNGKIERKLLIKMEDHTLVSTEFEDVAEISNCEKFETN